MIGHLWRIPEPGDVETLRGRQLCFHAVIMYAGGSPKQIYIQISAGRATLRDCQRHSPLGDLPDDRGRINRNEAYAGQPQKVSSSIPRFTNPGVEADPVEADP